jgi:hypothetical protein
MRGAGHVVRMESRRNWENFGGTARSERNIADSLFALIISYRVFRAPNCELLTFSTDLWVLTRLRLSAWSICNLVPATKPFIGFRENSTHEFFTKRRQICMIFIKIGLLTVMPYFRAVTNFHSSWAIWATFIHHSTCQYAGTDGTTTWTRCLLKISTPCVPKRSRKNSEHTLSHHT